MSEDWAVTHRGTGEVCYVKVAKGRRPSSHGYPAGEFKAVKLHREPHEDDTFDGKRIARCPIKGSQRERRMMLSRLDRAELLDVIERMIDDRLRAHGLIREAAK